MEPPNYESTVQFPFASSPPDPTALAGPSTRPSEAPTHVALAHRVGHIRVPIRRLQTRSSDGGVRIATFVLLSDVRRAVPAATGLVDRAGWQVPSDVDTATGLEVVPCRWEVPEGANDPHWSVFVPRRRDRAGRSPAENVKRPDKEERERRSAAAYATALDQPSRTLENVQTLGISGLGSVNDHESGQASSSSEFPQYMGRDLPSLREQDLQDLPPDFVETLGADEDRDPSSDGGSDSDADSLDKSPGISHFESRLADIQSQLTSMHHSLSDRMQAVLMRMHTIYNRLGTLEAQQQGGAQRRPVLPPLPPTTPNGAPPPFSPAAPASSGPSDFPAVPFRNEPHGTLPPSFREGQRPPVSQPAPKADPPPPYFPDENSS